MQQNEYNTKAAEAVKTYNVAQAKAIAEEAVKDPACDLKSLIQDGYTAGIMTVGQLFNDKKIFLPHVMTAASAMTAGIEILEPELANRGGATDEGLGTVVIGTVLGDVHSIGKDICAIMLKVGGFNVINLGRDVPVQKFVDTAKEKKAIVVASSALMTNTMLVQRDIEEALKAAGIRKDLYTNIGGAASTPGWAEAIGADVYSSSATDAVDLLVKLVSDS